MTSPGKRMWYEDLPSGASWDALWYGLVRCDCGGIRTAGERCPGCGQPMPALEWTVVWDNLGREHQVPPAFQGAEGRYEDYVYLRMLQREWLRPISDADLLVHVPEEHRPSPRAVVVIVFWTYFETRVERLLREAMKHLPTSITDDLLRRYSSVGSRLDRLYTILFSSTYWKDLVTLGHSDVSSLLQRIQHGRNAFMHGHPEALDASLIENLVAMLQQEHISWIAAFNHRVPRRS